MPTILTICGSLRSGSVNAAALATAAAVAPEGVSVDRYDGLAKLPHFNPDLDHDPLPEPVTDLRRRIAAADALLFCTPEYAGALPGSLKNLLDWTIGGTEIYGKPVGWINVSAAPTAAAKAHDSLWTVLGFASATIVPPACVHLPVTRQDVGADGQIVAPTIRASVSHVVRTLSSRSAAQPGFQMDTS